MKHTKSDISPGGFSLVEMLVVVAVIGIMAAIAIPNVVRMNDMAKESKDRRNAQNIASVFSAAQAAGLDFYVKGDEAATIKAVVTGGNVTDEGPFKGSFFGVPRISEAEQADAAVYLEMDDDNLAIVYKSL